MDPGGGTLLVVGLGNVLLGDEGFGVHVARALLGAEGPLPEGVGVLDAGVALFDVLPEMARYRRVILVDAMRRGGAPGSVYRMTWDPVLAERTGPALSLHDWGVAETLAAAGALRLMPPSVEIVGAEPESLGPALDLSPRLQAAADRVVGLLREEIRRGTAPGEPAFGAPGRAGVAAVRR